MLFEESDEAIGDLDGHAALDVVALHHGHDPSPVEKTDLGRRGRVAHEVVPGALRGLPVLAGEDRDQLVRFLSVLEGQGETRACPARGTTADGIHEDEGRPLKVLQFRIHLLGGPTLLDAQRGHLGPHGGHHGFIVHLRISLDLGIKK